MSAFRDQLIPFLDEGVQMFCNVALLRHWVISWDVADYAPFDIKVAALVFHAPDFFRCFVFGIFSVFEFVDMGSESILPGW